MPLKKIKSPNILIFFCLGVTLSFFMFSRCWAAKNPPEAEIGVSVSSNSVNRLAQRIDQTQELLSQKTEELKQRNKTNFQVALLLFGGGVLLGAGIILKDLYIDYQKKRIKKMKSARRRKKRKK